MKLMAGSTAAVALPLQVAQATKGTVAPDALEMPCRVLGHGLQRELVSPTFKYKVDLSDGLTAESWLNRLTGRTLSLGRHPEIELDLDASIQRLSITGWRTLHVRSSDVDPNREEGYLKGFGSMWFEDSSWPGKATPVSSYDTEIPLFRDYYWARTHVFLPMNARDRDLSLVLGGVGLYDYRFMRVFINGQEVGVREPLGGGTVQDNVHNGVPRAHPQEPDAPVETGRHLCHLL